MTADATGPAPQTIEDILAVAEDPAFRRVVTARIVLVPQALRDEHAALEAELAALISDTVSDPDRMRVAARLVDLEHELAGTDADGNPIPGRTVEFRFRNIGHRAWADLLRRHPPTDSQLRRDRSMDHNPETFPYAAMSASCVSHTMTPAQVEQLDRSGSIDVEQWSEMWGACCRANVKDAVPKSLAAGLILRASAGSAATALSAASPDQSS